MHIHSLVSQVRKWFSLRDEPRIGSTSTTTPELPLAINSKKNMNRFLNFSTFVSTPGFEVVCFCAFNHLVELHIFDVLRSLNFALNHPRPEDFSS